MIRNWQPYDKRIAFTFEEAAYLWCEQDPPVKPLDFHLNPDISDHPENMPNDVAQMYLELKNHFYSTHWIIKIFGVPQEREIPTLLKRRELTTYAKEVGQTPLFLFPKRRQTVQSASPTANQKKKRELIPNKDFYVKDTTYTTVYMNKKPYNLSTSRQRAIIKILHESAQKNTPRLRIDELNKMVNKIEPYQGKHVIRDSFSKKAVSAKKALLESDGKGYWGLKQPSKAAHK